MAQYESPKWKLFTSRPTPLLKRDILKWTYLSIGIVAGCKLTKLLAIGNAVEMDVFVDAAEHAKNLQTAERHFRTGKIGDTLRDCRQKVRAYRASGSDLTARSVRAMRELGGYVIYTYYVEWCLGPFAEKPRVRSLLIQNAAARDVCARLLYSLYDAARAWLEIRYTADIEWALYRELPTVPSAKAVAARKRFHVFFGTRQRSAVFTGHAAHSYLHRQRFSRVRNNVSSRSISGIAAGHGKASGRVKIVHTVTDLRDCQGKVIVSPDTIIEYTPFLKKNRAIVTDLGGLSSHAATVAREYKIPCIVGTKIATKVFKDGDMVEVNADSGTVTVIKRVST